AIASLTTRFKQYRDYEDMFGFLFTCDKLKLYNGDRSDIDANELYVELRSLDNYLPTENIKPLDVLNFLKQDDCYPNAVIAYRVLLTIPVTVASAERSFSKLKLLKSYLRSTLSQERLNGLALIATENDILVPLKLKGKFYRVAIRPALLYGSECWPITKALANRVEVAELRMLRWTCGRTLSDMIPNGVYRAELEVENIINRRRGRPKHRWEDRVKQDLKELRLSVNMTSDRNDWRARIRLGG
ncbi:zinc finger MYM-type protein 1, partial [Tanacetum coccineum]